MKKTLVLLCLFFLITGTAYSQVNFDISVKLIPGTSDTTGEVTITVTSGSPDYTYYITTHNPVKAVILEQSEKTRKNRHTFKGIKPGTYFVRVMDASGLYSFKSFIVGDAIVTQ
jgi:hypothetical protein